MSIVNSEIHEGVMLQEEFVSIPVSVFEDLIRAETERDILEGILTGEKKYAVDDVLKAIHTARKKLCRGALRIEIGVVPPVDPERSTEDTATTAENKEDLNGTEACE